MFSIGRPQVRIPPAFPLSSASRTFNVSNRTDFPNRHEPDDLGKLGQPNSTAHSVHTVFASGGPRHIQSAPRHPLEAHNENYIPRYFYGCFACQIMNAGSPARSQAVVDGEQNSRKGFAQYENVADIVLSCWQAFSLWCARGCPRIHGNAAYSDKPVEVKNATVTRWNWSNPHRIVEFDVKDDRTARL